MNVNKEKRLKYLGFNDFWFSVIGILTISIITTYHLSSVYGAPSRAEMVISWVVTLIFTSTDWFVNRSIMIYLRKKYPGFKDDARRIIILFLAVAATVLLVDFIGTSLLSLIPGVSAVEYQYRIQALLYFIVLTIMVMAIYEAIYYNIRLKKSVRDEEQAKQVLLQAQLDALLNQAQPHFFFNTLNTLRDIIDQNPKADAMEFVDKLSEIYRFLLEAGNENLITLEKELRFTRAYIHIQSERFGNNLKVNWDIPSTTENLMIVPMSLQLLLENAIKHNVISKAKPLSVNIAVQGSQLVVSNKLEPKSTQLPSTKVGLANIEKRYNLISDKSIEITNDGNQFIVSIPLLTVSEKRN